MEYVLRFKYEKGVRFIYPAHAMVKSWRFEDGQEAEATLCHAMAVVAEKNGMSANDIIHLFPAVLRMIKSDIDSAVVGQSEQLCDHPRSERSYIGQNMLRCNRCGKEFS